MSDRLDRFVVEAGAVGWWLDPAGRSKLEAEVRDHLESAVAEGVTSGMSLDEAESAAMRRLGSPRRAGLGLLGVSGWGNSRRVFWTVVALIVVSCTAFAWLEAISPYSSAPDQAQNPYPLGAFVAGMVILTWLTARKMAFPLVPILVGTVISLFTATCAMTINRTSYAADRGVVSIDIRSYEGQVNPAPLLALADGVDMYRSGGIEAVNEHFGSLPGYYVLEIYPDGEPLLGRNREAAVKNWDEWSAAEPSIREVHARREAVWAAVQLSPMQRLPGLLSYNLGSYTWVGFLLPALLASAIGWLLGQAALAGSILAARRRFGRWFVN